LLERGAKRYPLPPLHERKGEKISPTPKPLPRGALLAGEGGKKMPPSPCPFPRSALPTREGVKTYYHVWVKVPSLTSEAQWGRAREGAHFVGEG